MNSSPHEPGPVQSLSRFIDSHRRLTILTGAGCSTASGIPDYRDENGDWKHQKPMQFAEFLKSAENRRRYWARSFAGWYRISAAQPNDAHRSIAELENLDRINCVVTQNVDDLHRKAGNRKVIDLHGALNNVRCLACRQSESRENFQVRLKIANGDWQANVGVVKPDGDVNLDVDNYANFEIPECTACGGIMKPDVVFFGESIPPDRVAAARDHLQASDALLVIGSSLMVFSGYRFAREAHAAGKPIAIVNLGKTRADDLASLRIREDCAGILTSATAKIAA